MNGSFYVEHGNLFITIKGKRQHVYTVRGTLAVALPCLPETYKPTYYRFDQGQWAVIQRSYNQRGY